MFGLGRKSRKTRKVRRKDRQPTWQVGELETRTMLAGDAGTALELQVDLRGETGDEFAQIWAGDRLFETRRLSTEWQRFDMNIQDASIEASDVRIQFTNDLYEPGVIDRNVYVGTLFLNGEEIDPNGANSYSTATWRPEDGIVAGLGRGSVLNANGYLQFDEPQGSTVTVFARGEEGGEQFRAWAGSIEFLPTTVSTELEAYEFRINEVVDPGSVQVRFINDFFQPDNDIDFNLTVDRIEIDGVAYEAEAPEVFQTGVFRDGFFESGFLQTETLQGNGVFQFNRSEQLAERFEFDTSVSSDGLIEFSQGSFVRAADFSDGSFVGTTQTFGFAAPGAFQTTVEAYDSLGNVDSNFNDGQPVNLYQIVEGSLSPSQSLNSVTALDVLVDAQDRVLIPLNVVLRDAEGNFLNERWAIRFTRGGEVDASYGDQGIFRFSSQLTDRPDVYNIDGSGRLIGTDGRFVVRVTDDGALDSSFGDNGVVTLDRPATDVSAGKIDAKDDGSVVVFVTRRFSREGDSGYVLQLNEDGSTDNQFGTDGVAVIPRARFSLQSSFAENYDELTLDSQGRIYVTGSRSILRYTSEGQLDTTFGAHGLTKIPERLLSDGVLFQFSIESGPVIDDAGRVIVAAAVGFVRFDAFGQLDETFSGDGLAAFFDAGSVRSFDVSELQIDSSGRLFSAIRTTQNPAIGVWRLVS